MAFYNQGLAHYQKGDYGQATKDYEDAITFVSSLGSGSNNSYNVAFYKRGMDFHAKGDKESDKDYDYSLAIKDRNRLMVLETNSSRIRHLLHPS
jgi:tetratricopeptide (TPR) repeat protein